MNRTNKIVKIDNGLICEVNKMQQTFSLQKWIIVPLLIIATIICGYFALPTTRTVAVTKSVEQVKEGYVTKNIEDIEVGDAVFAYDVTTGKVSKCKVTDTFERTSDHLRYLTVRDSRGTQIFETTDSHPFWVVTDSPDLSRAARDIVEENGAILQHENIAITEHGYYVEAKDLKVGDTFIGVNGELSILASTERVEFLNGITVYNFTVENNHNYFVVANLEAYKNGANVVLVHNADEKLYRQLLSRESAARLERKSLEAETHPKNGIHGVSVSAEEHPSILCSSADRSSVEEHFRVHNTPTDNDQLHRTIELPRPVTKDVADIFNKLFGR